MKKKRPLDQEIYLTEYLSGTVASSFEKESDQRILCWDFSKDLDEKLKMQIELLLNEIVKLIKKREERRNRYLLPLKCLFCYAEKSGLKDIMKIILFCRKLLFLESKNINWEANVWLTERLNISSERYSSRVCIVLKRYKISDFNKLIDFNSLTGMGIYRNGCLKSDMIISQEVS